MRFVFGDDPLVVFAIVQNAATSGPDRELTPRFQVLIFNLFSGPQKILINLVSVLLAM